VALLLPLSFRASVLRRCPSSTVFPYTTLFRSPMRRGNRPCAALDGRVAPGAHHASALAALVVAHRGGPRFHGVSVGESAVGDGLDRKSTRLNSSHVKISYAVFCLKKKR